MVRFLRFISVPATDNSADVRSMGGHLDDYGHKTVDVCRAETGKIKEWFMWLTRQTRGIKIILFFKQREINWLILFSYIFLKIQLFMI